MIAILHTWSQTLGLHPHLHWVVTGGALTQDGSRWIATRHRHFLFPVRALAKGFRGKFGVEPDRMEEWLALVLER